MAGVSEGTLLASRKAIPDNQEPAMPTLTQALEAGGFIAGVIALWAVLIYPVASWLGKKMKHHAIYVDPYIVKDMRGGSIGMNFYIADLMHDTQKSRPEEGDAVIILDICGMGMTVTRDRRGNVTSEFSTPQPPMPGEALNSHREFDTFDVHVNGQGDEKFKRYEFRPCSLAPRTWVIAI